MLAVSTKAESNRQLQNARSQAGAQSGRRTRAGAAINPAACCGGAAPQVRRKDELERRLHEIEDATRVFSRTKVLVRAN
jgi:hypothetical protein